MIPKKIHCPCCQEEVGVEDEKHLLHQTLGRMVDSWGGLLPIKREYLERGIYQWACDNCLATGKAIKADWKEQVYCDHNPYLAYFDIQKECSDCHNSYIFEKKEQLFWYEVLKFWVQSEPKQCPSCRKKRRAKNLLNKELSELLKDKTTLTKDQMLRLIVIYEGMEKDEQANYFRNRVKKLDSSPPKTEI